MSAAGADRRDGLTVPVPAWSGAVPPIGSNIDTPLSG